MIETRYFFLPEMFSKYRHMHHKHHYVNFLNLALHQTAIQAGIFMTCFFVQFVQNSPSKPTLCSLHEAAFNHKITTALS